jgi:hypothetical protein
LCHGTGRQPHPIIEHCRPQPVRCDCKEHCGQWHLPECVLAGGTGYRTVERQHVRGCHVLDCLLGKE